MPTSWTPGLRILRDFKKTQHYIDKIIVGEGEILLLKLLSGELAESQRVFTAKDIDYEMLNLDSADIPDFSGLQLEYYPYLSFYTSRSCPFQCGFCSETLQWGKYRKKQPENIVRQITLELVRELSPVIYEAECQPFYFFLTGQVNSNNREGEPVHGTLPEVGHTKSLYIAGNSLRG